MPLRPLLVSDGLHPRHGGPPRVVVQLASQLSTLGHSPEILTLCSPGEEQSSSSAWPELERSNVPVHVFRREFPQFAGRARAVNAFCRAQIRNYSVVHVHGIWAEALADVTRHARDAGVPYVVASHGMLDRWSMARSRWKKILALKFLGVEAMLRGASGIQFGTNDEAMEGRGLGFGFTEYAIPNGFNPTDFVRVREQGKETWLKRFPELKGRHPVILFLGRLHPKKGVHLLLEAFSRLKAERGDAALLIVGIPQIPDYTAQLQRRCEDADLKGSVVFVTDIVGREALPSANVSHASIMPSFQEGFSIAILESLAMGLPVVATQSCHMSELETVGVGKVVPTTVEGVMAGLRWIISQAPTELENMGTLGQTWAQTNFTWPAVSQQVVSMYEQVIAASRERHQ